MLLNYFERRVLALALISSILIIEFLPLVSLGIELPIFGKKSTKDKEKTKPLTLEYPKGDQAGSGSNQIAVASSKPRPNPPEPTKKRDERPLMLEGTKNSNAGKLYDDGSQQIVVAPPKPLSRQPAAIKSEPLRPRSRPNNQQLAIEGSKGSSALYGDRYEQQNGNQIVVAPKQRPKVNFVQKDLSSRQRGSDSNRMAIEVSRGQQTGQKGENLYGSDYRTADGANKQIVVKPRPEVKHDFPVQPPKKTKAEPKPSKKQPQPQQKQIEYTDNEPEPEYVYLEDPPHDQQLGVWTPSDYAANYDSDNYVRVAPEQSDLAYKKKKPPPPPPQEEGPLYGHHHTIEIYPTNDCSHILGSEWNDCRECCYPADSNPFGSVCRCHKAERHYTSWLG